MEIYKIPRNTKAIIFDIDGTLYNSDEYVAEQVDVQIRYWSKLKGISADQGRKLMEDFRREWSKKHQGKKISLGNAFTHFGIDIDTSIRWRNQLMRPEDYLSTDTKLIQALEELKAEGIKMIAVTNNPVEAARKTLKAVGIDFLIPHIVGLDTCHLSKPARPMLDKALEILSCKAEDVISIGDRYDIDLALPLEMGMGGIVVAGAFELYDLPALLRKKTS